MSSRRNFIQMVSAPLIAMPFFSQAETVQENLHSIEDGPILKVALLGLGGYANIVAKAMQNCKRAKITALISGTPSKLDQWGEKYSVPKSHRFSYEELEKIKNNPDIDAVYIMTPNLRHPEFAIKVANLGKHVISEKPMATNVKDAQRMIDACKKAGVKLLVGYRMHFEPNTLEIIKKREAGEFGKILFFQGLSGFIIGDPKQWRLNKQLAGGGSMMDIGIYSINGARYMLGEEPIWVTAQETKTDPEKFKEGVDETILFQMGFPSGAVASCLSTYALNNLDKFYLNGTKGFAEMMPSTGYGPIKAKTNKGELSYPHVTHQTIQMDEFAAILHDGKTPKIPVDGEEGLKDMKIIEAIFEAVKSGKKVALK
ncbi:Gfo/Idh/MocA family oxidoreductase [Cytophagaceae bacterium 50C-KIRBA]|uniref:Gfo/Idh/MocA family oxidoreductase n=1 Tax=Aquirufa beregesia TaxID=2516556 RepID=A0ABX0EW03_9BACT|nr:Gfo/Idh/MocA family oxidoreductase [Aquirufa beregesia]NGZ44629.1 Gfo/Idh/MocA family oxidoreductase [Aquirufa beregesia]